MYSFNLFEFSSSMSLLSNWNNSTRESKIFFASNATHKLLMTVVRNRNALSKPTYHKFWLHKKYSRIIIVFTSQPFVNYAYDAICRRTPPVPSWLLHLPHFPRAFPLPLLQGLQATQITFLFWSFIDTDKGTLSSNMSGTDAWSQTTSAFSSLSESAKGRGGWLRLDDLAVLLPLDVLVLDYIATYFVEGLDVS